MVGENNNNMVGENNNKEVEENFKAHIISRISCPYCRAEIDLDRPSLEIPVPGPFRCPNPKCEEYFIVTGDDKTCKFPYVPNPWPEPKRSLYLNY